MSKKRRRRGARRPNIPQVTLERVTGDGEAPAKVASGAHSARPQQSGFSPDYSPVIKDLKRIAGLASFFIVLLIVLSFILG